MTDQLEQKGLYSPKHHATSRPQLLETEATHRAIALSTLIDAPILIVHVSSPSAAQHIRDAQTRGLPIYAETCPQYLFLTRADLDKPGFEGAKCVCSPPPREGAGDQEGIWRGVGNGTFAVLSSDHCPFLYGDGEVGKRSSVCRFCSLSTSAKEYRNRAEVAFADFELPQELRCSSKPIKDWQTLTSPPDQRNNTPKAASDTYQTASRASKHASPSS